MKNSFAYRINYLAVLIAIGSFVLGTLCLLLFKASGDTGFVGIGYCYTLLAAFVNTITLFVVLVNGLIHYKDYVEHLKALFVILLNIPIVCLYLELL
ncbi:MAG: hypothetical protein Mars2KO_04920 [Maribacter sp.]|uniref:hypothetical protein n=1 Tax=Maribacter sp. 2307UL18-2 TaxID=3386274 RepID=UPI0039BD49DC